MNFPFYIAKRYLFTKSKNKAINYITIIASLGVITGTAALFIVLSGFAGLKAFSLEFTTLTDPDLKLFPEQSKTFIFSNDQRKKMSQIKGINSFSEIVEDKVLITCDDKFLAVDLKGVDSYYPQKTIDSILAYGDWMESDLPQIVSGWDITNKLGFDIYDLTKIIRLYAPRPGTGQLLSIREAFKSMKVVNSGIFQINDNLNNSLIFTSIDNAKYLLGISASEVSSVEIITTERANLKQINSELNNLFGSKIVIKDRAQLNGALYKMLNTEQLVVYLIFTLILIIALFNIVGSIVMMILEKKENLKTLFNIGATKRMVQKVFFLHGLLITFFGGLAGLSLGIIVIFFQQYFELVLITPTLPYPVILSWINILISFATIFILGSIASLLASFSIKKLDFKV
ncbi:MAG: ABC transporter permease [Formosa sp.]|nr:ABC transporter permease [Formosa sp.]MAR99103.1 ABC transporter permease [Formosa sp.]